MIDALVIRYHKAEILAALEGTDDFGQTVRQDLRDRTLGALSCMPLDDHLHRIAQKRVSGIIFSYKDILLLAIYGYKAEAPGMACIHADDFFDLCFSVASPLGQRDLPFRKKRVQNPVQLLPILLLHLQKNRQLLLLHGHIVRIMDKIV